MLGKSCFRLQFVLASFAKMNVDVILETFARHEVGAILIGGMNFLLRHQPVLTFDVDFWVKDSEENLVRVDRALRELGAEWGRDDASWGPLPEGTNWLRGQTVFCLTSRHGAIDIFREVRGLEGQYENCAARSTWERTSAGTSFRSLADEDMLACQLVLPDSERRLDRVSYLRSLKEKS
jgi:hypothetical protein